MHYWYLLPVLVTYLLLVTLTSTRGSYKYITSALFAEYKLRTLRPTDTFLLIVKSDPYDSVKRVTDAHRVLVFDVVTQFRAIFATEEDETDEGDGFSDGGDYENDDTKNERQKTLPSWCAFRTESFIHVLSKHVPLIDEGSRISAAFEHARYCSQSLARVGCDHRSLLLPIFSSAAFALFSERVEVAVSDFERSAQTHRWSAFPSIGGASGGDSVRPAGFDDESKEKDASESSEQNQNKPPAPPAALAEHVLVVRAFPNNHIPLTDCPYLYQKGLFPLP